MNRNPMPSPCRDPYLCWKKPKDVAAARAMLRDPEITVTEVAKRLGVVPSTLYRHLPRARAAAMGDA